MRLIDADELEKELEKTIADYEKRMPDWSSNDWLTSGKDAAYKWGGRADGVDDALEMVKYAPTIEAEPVKHGRWKRLSHFWLECSCCGDTSENPYNYCPECGARMDGVDE